MSEPEPRLRALLTSLRSESARKVVALILLSLGTALLVMEHVRVPLADVDVGQVVDRDVRATLHFSFEDEEATETLRDEAEEAVRPAFDHDTTLMSRSLGRVTDAFETARRHHTDALLTAQAEEREGLSEAESSEIARDFLRLLEHSLSQDDLQRIVTLGFDTEVQDAAAALITQVMRGYIVADKALLPSQVRAVSVVRILPEGQDEVLLDDFSQVRALEEARRELALELVQQGELSGRQGEVQRAALAVARAVLRPNFSYNQLLTEDRRRAARVAVRPVTLNVQRGTAIAREGDVLNRLQVVQIRTLQSSRSGFGAIGVLFALFGFSAMLYFALHQFGAGYIRKFSTRAQDIEASAVVAILLLLLGRTLVELSPTLASVVGQGMSPTSLYFLAPFCGGAMLLRVLINSESALLWIIGTSAMMGLMMDQQVLFALFFAISGVTAATTLGHTRERVNVLRAGLQTGLINAGAALLITLVQTHLGDAGAGELSATQPLWDVGFAFLGGVLGGFLALGLVPVFELFGFVTDFKLLELANLNHPLLRQLMLRAPGTYHHSVTVASLCESAAEAIGANALQTRVACYFHDIGKSLQPRYFIENQGGGPNPHDKLNPHTSARVIINHVVDGAAIARQYKLPKPILDGIEMHHGTGIIQYFYAKAAEQAGDANLVDEADFRYPGKKPDSRETGIMMLADKVEAAVRTLKDPSGDRIRALIQKIVNSSVTDGQFEECPLTIEELYKIVDAFTNTLLGIYHHRIEYPGMPQRLPQTATEGGEVPTSAIITLEMNNPFRADRTDPEVNVDRTDPSMDLESEVSDPTQPVRQVEPLGVDDPA